MKKGKEEKEEELDENGRARYRKGWTGKGGPEKSNQLIESMNPFDGFRDRKLAVDFWVNHESCALLKA